MDREKAILFLKRTFIIILVFAMQTVYADKIRIFGVSPNFPLALVLVVSFKNYPSYGLYCALILGLLTDSVSGRIFGGCTFLFVLIEVIIKNYYTKLFTESFLFETLGGLVFNFIFSVLYGIGRWMFVGSFTHIFLEIVLFEFLYNQLVFMLFLIISKRFKKKRRSMFRIWEKIFLEDLAL